ITADHSGVRSTTVELSCAQAGPARKSAAMTARTRTSARAATPRAMMTAERAARATSWRMVMPPGFSGEEGRRPRRSPPGARAASGAVVVVAVPVIAAAVCLALDGRVRGGGEGFELGPLGRRRVAALGGDLPDAGVERAEALGD